MRKSAKLVKVHLPNADNIKAQNPSNTVSLKVASSRRRHHALTSKIPSFSVYWKDEKVAEVTRTRSGSYNIKVLTTATNKLPFKHNATIKEVSEFLEDRCFPKDRDGKAELLNVLGLSAYNHLRIIQKTHGVDFDDFLWIKTNEDPSNLSWKDVRLR